MEGGDLMQVIEKQCAGKGKLNERQVARWVLQILEGLCYLHTKNVMHRDIKLENVMIDFSNKIDREGVCKITDFGFAKTKQRVNKEKEPIGTPVYMAPEMVCLKHHDNRVDVWALGIMTCELLFGHAPFEGRNAQELFDEILEK